MTLKLHSKNKKTSSISRRVVVKALRITKRGNYEA